MIMELSFNKYVKKNDCERLSSERHYTDETNTSVIYFEDGICSFGLLEDLTYKNCMGVEEVMEMIWCE